MKTTAMQDLRLDKIRMCLAFEVNTPVLYRGSKTARVTVRKEKKTEDATAFLRGKCYLSKE